MTHKIADHPIHLGLGATAVVESPFDGAMDWYARYSDRHADDGAEGRLVSMYTFTTSWDVWEMHPQGSEVVLCTAGAITLVQEAPDGAVTKVTLGPGEYAINERACGTRPMWPRAPRRCSSRRAWAPSTGRALRLGRRCRPAQDDVPFFAAPFGTHRFAMLLRMTVLMALAGSTSSTCLQGED